MKRKIYDEYLLWCKNAAQNSDLTDELKIMTEEEIEDAFYKNLEFGTGGLRGVIGAGTNRMNVYTVSKASQGLANYICKNYNENNRKIAVSYDSRIKSDLFAKVCSEVFAANGITVYIYPYLMPTPCLSFAVRHLKCSAGVMITASHNPGKYNGYKVYGQDGCQITNHMASNILAEIENIDIFCDIHQSDFEKELNNGNIQYIKEDVYTAYTEMVKSQTFLGEDDCVNKEIPIVYTPLNGTGLKPVMRALKESGYKNITVVKEQENPDGKFPTCPYPNPEIPEALELGIKYAKELNADLLLATDPDCDRVGIAVKNGNDYVLLTGNEVGVLLLDYICSQRRKKDTMPENPVAVKTIVTTSMAEKIASEYNINIINVLTGFKYIGEQIALHEDSYVFGFEESYGYLSGNYVRDKDGVNAALIICEMYAYLKSRGTSLIQKLNDLYNKHGYFLNTLYTFSFEGISGYEKMQSIMRKFRSGNISFGKESPDRVLDYSKGIDSLPVSDVIKFEFITGDSAIIRPSGTEPKLKVYISVCGKTKEDAKAKEKEFIKALKTYIQ